VQHESSDHPDPPPHTVADSSSQLDLGLIDSDSEEDMCPNFSIPIHSRNPDSRTNRKEEKVPLDAMIVFRRRSKRSPRRPLARIFADRASSRMKPLSPSKCNIRANNRNGMRRLQLCGKQSGLPLMMSYSILCVAEGLSRACKSNIG